MLTSLVFPDAVATSCYCTSFGVGVVVVVVAVVALVGVVVATSLCSMHIYTQ